VVLGPRGVVVIDDGWKRAVGLVSESTAELIIIIVAAIIGIIVIIIIIIIVIIIGITTTTTTTIGIIVFVDTS
jgi:hypothetical protein